MEEQEILTETVETRKVEGKLQHRAAQATVSNIDEENRAVEFSFGSEIAVERWFGIEQLRMTKDAANLERLNSGGALLSEHDRRQQIGVVEKAWIGDDKRAYCRVRFSRNAKGQEEFNDVVDGIRTNVSFAYTIDKYEREKGEKGAPDKITATRWTGMEVSLVSIPADHTVGVGREHEQGEFAPVELPAEKQAENKQTRGSEIKMDENENQPAADQFSRERSIIDYGNMFGVADLARQFASDPNKSLADLQRAVAEKYRAETPIPQANNEKPATELGLNEREVKKYSMARAILAAADGNWKGAEFERECSEEIADRLQRSTAGFFVPLEVQNAGSIEQNAVRALKSALGLRDLSVAGGGAAGAYLVGIDHMPQSFIEVLRSKMKMLALGVQVMSGLVGNPSVPRQDGTATGYWVSEGQAPNASDQSFGQLGMSPKTCGAVTEFTRQLLLQSAPGVDMLVKSDIAAVLARTVDKAIINGSGSSGQPRGILNTTGVSEVTMAGATFEFVDAVQAETDIAEADAPDGASWLMRPSVRGVLKSREKDSNTAGIYLIDRDDQLNGYDVAATTQMPTDTLIFGVYNQIILAEWGILEIEANRLGSGFRAGNIEVRGLHSVDVAIRYPQAFKKFTSFA